MTIIHRFKVRSLADLEAIDEVYADVVDPKLRTFSSYTPTTASKLDFARKRLPIQRVAKGELGIIKVHFSPMAVPPIHTAWTAIGNRTVACYYKYLEMRDQYKEREQIKSELAILAEGS